MRSTLDSQGDNVEDCMSWVERGTFKNQHNYSIQTSMEAGPGLVWKVFELRGGR